MDVGAHPHIGIQTATWLFDGQVMHHDSIGGAGLAEPGVLNLMTAGRGIAHAETTPGRGAGSLWGVQLWIALPDGDRETAPAFSRVTDPAFVQVEGARSSVFAGSLGGATSPARTFSPIVGADVRIEPNAVAELPLDVAFEHALVLIEGGARVHGRDLATHTLYDLGDGRRSLEITAGDPGARALLLGGAPFDEEIAMWWNFVGRTKDDIRQARDDWERGRRFGEVSGYDGRRMEAPPLVATPVAR